MSGMERVDGEPYTTGEVAHLFRVDPHAVRRWTSKGLLPYFLTPGGHRRYHAEDVEKMMHTVEVSERRNRAAGRDTRAGQL